MYQFESKEILRRQLEINRDQAIQLGKEAIRIIRNGYYDLADGSRIEIREKMEKSVDGTVNYPPEILLPQIAHGNQNTRIEIQNCTTLTAVQQLLTLGTRPVALNFASAVEPGGGFLRGARAQEEYLARSSTLFACLQNNPMYAYHESLFDPFYSDYVIYSPEVVVFRDDDGALISIPYTCAILTSPAVLANAVRRTMPEKEDQIGAVMWSRILKVLAVAIQQGHTSIVLGAWGCGAFGNDGYEIAGLFKRALDDNFVGAFENVIFAITDWSSDYRFIGPFRKIFRI
ncbi:MAG: TIGR02452 family protein [Anaerolineaceae bacterium]|nr:TIGR02452 family protein [Anaerolineaceae bacterium]